MDLIVLACHEKGSNTQQLKVLLRNEGTLENKKIVYDLDTDLHSFILHLKFATDLEQPFQQDLPHLSANLGVPEVRMAGDAGRKFVGERLVMVDEMLNDVRKVGKDLWGAGGKILGLCLGWSSDGLRAIG